MQKSGYTQYIRQNYLNEATSILNAEAMTILDTDKNKLIEDQKYMAYISSIVQKLKEYHAKTSCMLAFSLVRWLHDVHGKEKGDTVIIREKLFPNKSATDIQVMQENQHAYIDVLTEISGESQKRKLQKKRRKQIFRAIFLQNCFPDEEGNLRMFTKSDIIELGFLLMMDPFQIDWILTRTLEESWCVNSSLDLCYACALSHPAFSMDDATQLHAEYLRRKEKNSHTLESKRRIPGVTTWVKESFEEHLRSASGLKKQDMYIRSLNLLLENQLSLDVQTVSARNLYRRLVAVAYQERISKETRNFGNIILTLQTLPRRNPTTNLDREKIEQIENSFFDLSQKGYYAWRYPVRGDDGVLYQSQLGERLKKILNEQEAPKKNDILFLAFLSCASFWESENSHPTPSQRIERLEKFTYICNRLLEMAVLPEFYFPGIIETAMCISILQQRPLEVYLNTVSTLPTTIHKKSKVSVKKREASEIEKNYKNVADRLIEWTEKSELYTSITDGNLLEIVNIAEKFKIFWKEIEYSSAKIVLDIHSDKIRFEGGKTKEHDMPELMKAVLLGKAELEVQFPATQNTSITLKSALTKYGINPDFENERYNQIVRKAVLSLLTGYIICTCDIPGYSVCCQRNQRSKNAPNATFKLIN